jgi:hypothetical protein
VLLSYQIVGELASMVIEMLLLQRNVLTRTTAPQYKSSSWRISIVLFEHTVRYFHQIQVYDKDAAQHFPKTKLDKTAVLVLSLKIVLREVGCLTLN